MKMPIGVVAYHANLVPDRYRCGGCGAHGVKLWRRYQTFLEHQALFCAACACADQNVPNEVGDDGRRPWMPKDAGGNVIDMKQRIDQIGWLIPAVPTEDGDTFWGYTSVPQAGVDWWQRLPVRA